MSYGNTYDSELLIKPNTVPAPTILNLPLLFLNRKPCNNQLKIS